MIEAAEGFLAAVDAARLELIQEEWDIHIYADTHDKTLAALDRCEGVLENHEPLDGFKITEFTDSLTALRIATDMITESLDPRAASGDDEPTFLREVVSRLAAYRGPHTKLAAAVRDALTTTLRFRRRAKTLANSSEAQGRAVRNAAQHVPRLMILFPNRGTSNAAVESADAIISALNTLQNVSSELLEAPDKDARSRITNDSAARELGTATRCFAETVQRELRRLDHWRARWS